MRRGIEWHLDNYFNFHVCLSIRPFSPFWPFHPNNFRVLSCSDFQKPGQTAAGRGNAKLRILDFKTTWSEFQKPSQTAAERGEAELRILDFKTTWSEFQMPSQTAPAEAKPRCVYSILKPHGQSFITSPESVQSSCVR